MRLARAAFVLAGFAAAPAPAAAEELAALLSRLTEHAARVKALSQTGVTVATTTEQRDGKGQVESKTESLDRRFVRDGAEITELRRFVRDGKDETREEQARRAERKAKASERKATSASFKIESPFSPEAAGRHTFTPAGVDPKDPKLSRLLFRPRGSPSPDSYEGEAGVDAETGTVRWIRSRPSKPPKHVTRMDIVMVYGFEAPGGPALSRVTVDAEGGLLFVRKAFRTESTFSDYGGGPGR